MNTVLNAVSRRRAGILMVGTAMLISGIWNSKTAFGQDVDVTPENWTSEPPLAGEIGRWDTDGSYVVTLPADAGLEVQGLKEMIDAIKSRDSFVRITKNFGGVIAREKIRINSSTRLPARSGGSTPAFTNNWSALGTVVFETHMEVRRAVSLSEGSLEASVVGTVRTTRSFRTIDVTFEWTAATRTLRIRTKDVASLRPGRTDFLGHYFASGRSAARSQAEKREFPLGFSEKGFSFMAQKEVSNSLTSVFTRTGPFHFVSQAGRCLVVRETFTDGRKTLRIRFLYDWQTDCESSVSQMAQVNVLACGTKLKWGGKVKVEDKKKPAINLNYDWSGACSATTSTVAVTGTWTARNSRMAENLDLFVEARPNGSGLASLRAAYESSMGLNLYLAAGDFVINDGIRANGTLTSGTVLKTPF